LSFEEAQKRKSTQGSREKAMKAKDAGKENSEKPKIEHAFMARGKTRVLNKPVYFYLDSGATSHMTDRRDLLTDYEELDEPIDIEIAKDETTVRAIGQGTLKVNSMIGQKSIEVSFSALFIPDLGTTLISLGTLEDEGCNFRSSQGIIVSHLGEDIIYAKNVDRMYIFETYP
jgi:hypothetical protein